MRISLHGFKQVSLAHLINTVNSSSLINMGVVVVSFKDGLSLIDAVGDKTAVDLHSLRLLICKYLTVLSLLYLFKIH
jgi:hypothetical protein